MGGPVVLVVGDVIDDVVVRPLAPPAPDSDTPAQIVERPGGSGANVACWLGWLGVPVRFAGRVGHADLDRHTRVFAGYGVDARLAADDQQPTGRIVVLADAAGRRSMFVDRGANLSLGRSDLPPALLDGVGWLHVSGYALFAQASRRGVLELVEAATRVGIGWSVDPSSVTFLRSCGRARFLSWTAGAALCLPNEDEAVLLAGALPADAAGAAAALTTHYPTVAVTLGQEGVLIAGRGGRPTHLVAHPARVVDGTGAGDAFAAGFLSRWVPEPAPTSAAQAGLAAAAVALGQVGGRPPTLLSRQSGQHDQPDQVGQEVDLR